MKKVTLLLVAIGVSLAALAATPLNVKTGQWEMTMATDLAGAQLIPPAMLEKMTSEQREAMGAMMAQSQTTGRKPLTSLECVTKEDLARPFNADDEDEDNKCEYTVLTSTGTSQDIAMNCKGEPSRSGKMHVEAKDPQSMTGAIDVEVLGKMPTKIHTTLSGRWLGPTCKKDD